tara:strand:- start:140 stop:376 length:237 start_codon:yes stop_codon:yes gene_type:complete
MNNGASLSLENLHDNFSVDVFLAMWIVLRGKGAGSVASVDGLSAPFTVNVYSNEAEWLSGGDPLSSWTVAADGTVASA